MSSKRNVFDIVAGGGPAWPVNHDRVHSGMTLHDWFASQAIDSATTILLSLQQDELEEKAADLIGWDAEQCEEDPFRAMAKFIANMSSLIADEMVKNSEGDESE